MLNSTPTAIQLGLKSPILTETPAVAAAADDEKTGAQGKAHPLLTQYNSTLYDHKPLSTERQDRVKVRVNHHDQHQEDLVDHGCPQSQGRFLLIISHITPQVDKI